MAKYELTEETRVAYGVTLYRIRALTAIGLTVAAGQLGGWVQSESNLNQYGDAWVYGDAQVSGDARVYGTARVSGNARVSGTAWVYGTAQVSGNARVKKSRHYVLIGPVGSEARTVTICRTKTDDHVGYYINAGCWTGTIEQLDERICDGWPNATAKQRARYFTDYTHVIALARLRVAEWCK